MAVTAFIYGKAFLSAFNKEIDLNEATKIKCMLCTSSYTPNQDTHDYKDDVNNEVVGDGYDAGGKEMTSLTPSYTADGNIFAFAADTVTWAASTITARYAVVYYNTGTANTSPLISYLDFGENKISTGGAFTITWDVGGVFKVTIS